MWNKIKKYKYLLMTSAVFFVLVLLILPFFRTGLIITKKPYTAEVKIKNGEALSNNNNLPPGSYEIISSARGYEEKAQIVQVKKYGKTKRTIVLKKQNLNKLINYDEFQDGFIVDGRYNDDQIPIYALRFFSESGKKNGLNYLKSHGIIERTHHIELIEDGG